MNSRHFTQALEVLFGEPSVVSDIAPRVSCPAQEKKSPLRPAQKWSARQAAYQASPEARVILGIPPLQKMYESLGIIYAMEVVTLNQQIGIIYNIYELTNNKVWTIMNYHILFKYNFMQMVCPKLHWQAAWIFRLSLYHAAQSTAQGTIRSLDGHLVQLPGVVTTSGHNTLPAIFLCFWMESKVMGPTGLPTSKVSLCIN